MPEYSKSYIEALYNARTEAITRVPQIVTYAVLEKGTGYKGSLRRTKVAP